MDLFDGIKLGTPFIAIPVADKLSGYRKGEEADEAKKQMRQQVEKETRRSLV